MCIIVSDSVSDTQIVQSSEGLELYFKDPAYARASAVLFDPDKKSLSVLLHEGLHHIGTIQHSSDFSVKRANMRSKLSCGADLNLSAPIIYSKSF